MKPKVVYFVVIVIVISIFNFVIIIKSKLHSGRVADISGLDVFYSNIDKAGFRNKLLLQQPRQLETTRKREAALVDVINTDEDIKNDTNTIKWNVTRNFYKLRKTRINPFDFKFIQTGENICNNNERPVLVILCLTTFYDIETREAIRETWGSVVLKQTWPTHRAKLPLIKLVFLLGGHQDSLVKKTIIEDEHTKFGDIVSADFKDSYDNLTLKVMMGLKWVREYCPHANFVVKIDQDMFLHVANLLTFLNGVTVPAEGILMGYQTTNGTVLRNGKWRVETNSFPFASYPNYTYGHCYVISGNAVPRILEATERMPYIRIEDAFITGIVRTVLGLKILSNHGFARMYDKPPRVCGFHNTLRIAATNTDNERKRSIWKELHYRHMKNCYYRKKHRNSA